jgi:hypothetical protein
VASPSKNAVVSWAERGQTADTGGKEGPGKGQTGLVGGAASIGASSQRWSALDAAYYMSPTQSEHRIATILLQTRNA